MLWMVQGWLVYELTGSFILLGVVGLAQAAPSIVLTLFGGVLADRWDQRRLVIGSQLLQVLNLAILAGLCFLDVVQVWHIMLIIAARATVGVFETPARQAMFPHLIDRASLTSAISLNSAIHPGTRIFGPAVAGIVLYAIVSATDSPTMAAGAIFSFTALGYAIFAILVYTIHLPPIRRSRGATVLNDLIAGLRLLWRTRIFGLLIGMTYFSHFFALSVTALFPVFAKDILGVGPFGLGLMLTAMGAGSLIGALMGAVMGTPQRWRSMIVGGLVVQGALLALFALSSWYPLSLLALFLMGIGSAQFNIAAQVTLQFLVADEFRGRVMSVWELTHMGVRPLGEIQVALVATLFTAPIAVMLGGTLVVAFALLVAAPNRQLRKLRNISAESTGNLQELEGVWTPQVRE